MEELRRQNAHAKNLNKILGPEEEMPNSLELEKYKNS